MNDSRAVEDRTTRTRRRGPIRGLGAMDPQRAGGAQAELGERIDDDTTTSVVIRVSNALTIALVRVHEIA
jgi:hypothetical protein